jgi:hypothetical protein
MAELQFTLTQAEYESLIKLARDGTKDSDGNFITAKALELDNFLKTVEARNGITRSAVWVRWQEAGVALPPATRFPDTWPPEMQVYIEFVTRAVARVDVEKVLAEKATTPINVLVTRDPGARLGWSTLDDFFQAG